MCDACLCLSNGSTYVCNAFNFSVDVSYSLIYETLKHDGHQHPLILSSSRSTGKCSACNSKGKIFPCSRFKFTLNFKCATCNLLWSMNNTNISLPFVILLKMTQVNITAIFAKKNEMQRISSTIVQIAFILLIPIVFLDMPKMMKKTYEIYIKFGVTRTYSFHQHPLTLVRETKDQLLCDECSKPWDALAYECTSCNFNIHQNCFARWENDIIDFHP